MNLRDESSSDHEAIWKLHLTSFPGPGEADLVDRLRKDGDTVISLVAIEGRVLSGHVVFRKWRRRFAHSALARWPCSRIVAEEELPQR
jgi:putative acetyltransferase